MSSPSIIPNDRLDRDFYIVLGDFKDGTAFRETDEAADYPTLITTCFLASMVKCFGWWLLIPLRAGRTDSKDGS